MMIKLTPYMLACIDRANELSVQLVKKEDHEGRKHLEQDRYEQLAMLLLELTTAVEAQTDCE